MRDIRNKINIDRAQLVNEYISKYIRFEDVTRREFLKSRKREYAYIRFSLAYWLVINTSLTSTEIAKYVGKDRTTINHACNAMQNAIYMNSLSIEDELFEVFNYVSSELEKSIKKVAL